MIFSVSFESKNNKGKWRFKRSVFFYANYQKGVEIMAVFRVEKNKGYTVMSNHHLRNKELSLKAKGLLSQMLSLPENWDYTLKGLSHINRESVDAIRTAVLELETAGYIIRRQGRDAKGKMTAIEYIIFEQPQPPELDYPLLENPIPGNPITENPLSENPTQLSKEVSNKNKSITQASNPIQSNPYEPQAADGMGMDARETYREIILENIEYDIIAQDKRIDRERLDEIVELLVETVCSARQTIRVAGDDFPAEVVKSRLLKLDSGHIQYVLDCMAQNTTYVRNIKKYLLAALFNAPSTMGNYYSALVNHDMYGSGERR